MKLLKMKRIFLYIFSFMFFLTMGASTPPQQTEWTVATLKEHFDRRFLDLEKAVNKAEAELKIRFEGVNEFRGALEDQQRTFMLRLEQETKDKSQDERIKDNAQAIAKIENMKQGGDIVWVYLISSVSFIAAIVSISINFIKKK